MIIFTAIAVILCGAQPTTQPKITPCDRSAVSDWDLYMLKLVNTARRKEGLRILRYDAKVGEAATHHNSWMLQNIGHIESTDVPDSFSHYETLDGQPDGAPADKTACFTGVTTLERFRAVGYRLRTPGENIGAKISSATIAIDAPLIDLHFDGFWMSPRHKENMLRPEFTVFGCHTQTRRIKTPLGGLVRPVEYVNLLTQNFDSTRGNHIFGILYDDDDGNGKWTPRDDSDLQREGLSGVRFKVYVRGSRTVAGQGRTSENGLFSAKVADGRFDIVFKDGLLPGGEYTVHDVKVSGANVDAGEFDVSLSR